MKNKKTIFSVVSVVLLVALLVCTLTACLKIGMKEENVIKRLKDNGATVTYERSAPMIAEWQSKGMDIKDILLAKLDSTEQVVDGATLDTETSDSDEASEAPVLQLLYVFYANDKATADWIEDKCKEYKSAEENADLVKDWNMYRYDNIVMIGDYRLLAIARQY
ncbi:MAG: hypothetical protein IJ226_01965 [Clostridia bacterium]|nr:hypothetical protein [Clostridia bacterium]